MKIYVVIEVRGEYSHREERTLVAYRKKADAQNRVLEETERCRVVVAKKGPHYGEYSYYVGTCELLQKWEPIP